jgi:hypothetical protein
MKNRETAPASRVFLPLYICVNEKFVELAISK